MIKQKYSPAGEQEQFIIKKLKAQKNTVRPSPQLLSKIIAQLPVAKEQNQHSFFYQNKQLFSWVRFAVPVGAMLFVGGIFFATTLLNTPSPNTPLIQNERMPNSNSIAISETSFRALPIQITTETALSLASLNAEEQIIEEQINFDEFFEDDLQMQEIDEALADLVL